jgi:hypothetical protein
VARILAQLELDDRAWLQERLEPPWRRRRRRLEERDRLISAVIREFFPELLPTVAARRLGSALTASAASNWRSEQHLVTLADSASERHRALHRIFQANGGKPLAWRRIAEIIGPVRNRIAVEDRHANTEAAGAGADRPASVVPNGARPTAGARKEAQRD